MAHTSFEDIDHDGTGVAPANLDESGALGRDEEVEPSEEDVLAEINRYMVDLLDRTRKKPESSAAPAAAAEPKPAGNRRSGEERRVQNDQHGAKGAGSQAKSPAEPLRKKRPQQEPDLLAMREVANHSARDAMAAHDSKLIANRARGKLSVAFVAACTTVLLFWMEPSYTSGTFPMALLAVLIAGIWGTQALRLFLESRCLVRAEPPVKAR